MSVPKRQITEPELRPNARLWGTTLIGVLTVICAFPAGMVLAIINWQQMGLLAKARRYLYGTVAATYLFVLILLLVPAGFGQIVYFAVNIGCFFLLRRELERDADAYAYAGYEALPANPFLGVAIAVGLLLLLILLFAATAVLLVTFGLVPGG